MRGAGVLVSANRRIQVVERQVQIRARGGGIGDQGAKAIEPFIRLGLGRGDESDQLAIQRLAVALIEPAQVVVKVEREAAALPIGERHVHEDLRFAVQEIDRVMNVVHSSASFQDVGDRGLTLACGRGGDLLGDRRLGRWGEWRSLAPDRRKEMALRRDAYERRFRAVIADGIAAGTFAPVDPAVSAAFILTALNGIVTWYRPDGRLKPGAIATAFADLALRAVLADEPAAEGGDDGEGQP